MLTPVGHRNGSNVMGNLGPAHVPVNGLPNKHHFPTAEWVEEMNPLNQMRSNQLPQNRLRLVVDALAELLQGEMGFFFGITAHLELHASLLNVCS